MTKLPLEDEIGKWLKDVHHTSYSMGFLQKNELRPLGNQSTNCVCPHYTPITDFHET